MACELSQKQILFTCYFFLLEQFGGYSADIDKRNAAP